jgi:hypothetical protein
MSTSAALVAALLTAFALAGSASPSARTQSCPGAWKSGWQHLADRIGADVYCPSWMPNPLDGRIGSESYQFTQLDKRGGYLVSFIYYEDSYEVHVNFRRFAGIAMPRCRDLETNRQIPCYSDAAGELAANGVRATFYTVARDADQWHLSYLWRHAGATYVISEHVAPPYGFKQVKANVARIFRGLALLKPAS